MGLETEGSSKGVSRKRETGGMTGRWGLVVVVEEGGDMGRLSPGYSRGIARRLLIRTQANEVQGHSIHTNVSVRASLR